MIYLKKRPFGRFFLLISAVLRFSIARRGKKEYNKLIYHGEGAPCVFWE